jgi:hypothetical protein
LNGDKNRDSREKDSGERIRGENRTGRSSDVIRDEFRKRYDVQVGTAMPISTEYAARLPPSAHRQAPDQRVEG